MRLRAGEALLFAGVFFAFSALPACSADPDITDSAEEASGEELPPEAGASALLPYPNDTAPPAPLVDETNVGLGLPSEESPSDKRAVAEVEKPTAELRAETNSPNASSQGVYFDADRRLRRYATDDELMAILQTEPRLSLITGDANTIIRVNYDEHGRLLTRTVWKVPSEPEADTLNTVKKTKSTIDTPKTAEKTKKVEPAGKAKPAVDILELAEESTTDVLESPAEIKEKTESVVNDSKSSMGKAETAVESSGLAETEKKTKPTTERAKPATKTTDLPELVAEAKTPDDTPAEGLVCKSITEYRYDGDSPRAASKTHRVPAEQRLEETRYRPSGDTESVAVYRESDEQQKVSSREDFTYDAENRLVEKIAQTFDEQGKAVTERVQYRYTGKAAEPDCERYLDGEIKFKLMHESETAYAEIRYLAYGLSVQTYYRDNRKALELYLQDGKEVRRKQF